MKSTYVSDALFADMAKRRRGASHAVTGPRMKVEMRGNAALVTGSSRGIGRAIATTFAEQGCDVLLTGRDAAALREVAADVQGRGRKAVVVAIDLNEEGAAPMLVNTARREFG